MIIDDFLEELSKLEGVEAIAIGGSRASGYADKASDYDVYVYYSKEILPEKRLPILEKYCKQIELNNTFWEAEDNCIMKDSIPIDIIYRNWSSFEKSLDAVVFGFQAYNGYTTCLWHNVINSSIAYDRTGAFSKFQEKYRVSYPRELRDNIIEKNMALLSGYLPSYEDQIKKAVQRNDKVSINHRTTEFLSSYFDIIFALNFKTHPGEKRLVQICKKECSILPANFEENLDALFSYMFTDALNFMNVLKCIILEIRKVIK